jgi:hypothetical protein
LEAKLRRFAESCQLISGVLYGISSRNSATPRYLRFGMGLSSTRIGEPTRRDRLLLVSAFAMALLTLLGATGESLGMDRLLKSNTSKSRSHSGCLVRAACSTN